MNSTATQARTSHLTSYDAFGNVVTQRGERDSPFAFSSKYQDTETGFYYYVFRYRQPETGQWLNRDQIWERGGFNLYGFVGNDCVNGIDFLGLANWSSTKGKEALDLSVKVRDSVKAGKAPSSVLPNGHACCQSFLSLQNCTGYDCITYSVAVLSCGYRLNGKSRFCEKARSSVWKEP